MINARFYFDRKRNVIIWEEENAKSTDILTTNKKEEKSEDWVMKQPAKAREEGVMLCYPHLYSPIHSAKLIFNSETTT